MDAIKKKFQNSGMPTLSDSVRAMIFKDYIVQMDKNGIHAIYKLVADIANSINQIALRVNLIGNVYLEDIAEIKKFANQIIQPILFLHTRIIRLKQK